MANKLAIVTGASTGIGFELAHLAAQNGYDLIVAANEDLIEAAARDFQAHGVEVQALNVDLSTTEGVDTMLAAAKGRQIDLVCANAGHGLGHGFLDQAVKDWRLVVDTNITGTLYLLQNVLKPMVMGRNATRPPRVASSIETNAPCGTELAGQLARRRLVVASGVPNWKSCVATTIRSMRLASASAACRLSTPLKYELARNTAIRPMNIASPAIMRLRPPMCLTP